MEPPGYDPMNTAIPLCETCQERFAAPGERHCNNCLMYVEEIDERDCRSCGCATGLDGSCAWCVEESGDSTYWRDMRR